MKAIEITAPGGPEVLRLVERPAPVPGAGEVLIRVAAAGVNRPDVLQRQGLYPVPPGVTDIPGLEVAGPIVEGDARALSSAGLRVGDRVCALVSGGGYAELCTAPIGQCLPVPAGWSDVEAAGVPETFFTVWSNVFDRARLEPGETLLVHGATSGIGVTAIQLAKAFGSQAIATAGSDDKCRTAIALGATHAINYRGHDFVAEVQRFTGGRGVHVVLDMVAGDYVGRGLQCLAEDGRLVIIAVQGGTDSRIDSGLVLRKRLTISGSTLRPRAVAFKSAIASALKAKVWPMLATREIRPIVHEVFPAARAADAHRTMEAGTHVGKLVLEW